MSKERELLIGAVEWMHELKYTLVEERDQGDRDLLNLVADINKIEQLLNNPEQDLEVLKKDWVNFGHTAGRKEGYNRGYAIAREEYKQKVINAFWGR